MNANDECLMLNVSLKNVINAFRTFIQKVVPKTEKHGKIPENAAKIPFPKVPLNNHLYEYNLGRTFKYYA